MSGQATVTINEKQWAVEVAQTFTELTTGLSGRESLTEGNGMLFDLGYDCGYVDVDMSQMLFPLDIVFINKTNGVIGALRDIQPGQDVFFDTNGTPGARFFLEVNAGEAETINDGDDVVIEGYVAVSQIDIGSLMEFMVMMMVLVMGMRMVDKATEGPEKSRMLGGRKLPAGYKPVHQ